MSGVEAARKPGRKAVARRSSSRKATEAEGGSQNQLDADGVPRTGVLGMLGRDGLGREFRRRLVESGVQASSHGGSGRGLRPEWPAVRNLL